MPSVTRALRSANGPFSRRSISRRGCGTSEKCGSPGLGIGFGRAVEEGGADAAFLQPGDAASVCVGVGLLCAQSTSVVRRDRAGSARRPRWRCGLSSGTNTVARPAWTWAENIPSRVQLAATERSAVCQVCMWACMSPGSTKWPAQIDRLGVGLQRRCDGSDAAILDQYIAGSAAHRAWDPA